MSYYGVNVTGPAVTNGPPNLPDKVGVLPKLKV
jgi:hypothetical protein